MPGANQWQIGLASWIIQDGNYPDLRRGQPAEFALEFHPYTMGPEETTEKSALPLGHARYRVTGEIVHKSKGVWVLDFGLRAYDESRPPKGASVGSFVAAEIYLGIDPFFYFEELCQRPGMPPLVYSWRIERVSRQTAPFVETQDKDGRRVLARDESRLGYVDIAETNAWKDDGGHAEYVLHCIKLDENPKYRAGTAV